MDARDEKVFERYYFWTEIQRLRFDDALHKLSTEEFFLSESRIMQIIRRMLHEGKTIDGKTIQKPMFCGFKVKCGSPKRSSRLAGQLSLFPE